MGIMKDLETFEPRNIKTLFNYKISAMLENEQEAREVVNEYRISALDPKKQGLEDKKNNLKKKLNRKNK